MKWFPYLKFTDRNTSQTIYLAQFTVGLKHGTHGTPAAMIVDSGAQDTILDASVAPSLGINLSTCPIQKIKGITGEEDGRVHMVTMKFPRVASSYTFKVVFVENLGGTGVLGQIDFFTKFNVIFKLKDGLFGIEER